MENTVEKHFERIKTRLEGGADKLRQFRKDGVKMQTSDVPFVEADQSFANAEPPKDGDKYVFTIQPAPSHLDSFSMHTNDVPYVDSTWQLTSARPKDSSTFGHMGPSSSPTCFSQKIAASLAGLS